VLSAGGPPFDVAYCEHCFEAEEMRRFLHTDPAELNEELDRILRKAYTTWGDWPSLAYYVPQLLERHLTEGIWWDMLFYKLLWAARPGTIPRFDLSCIGRSMRDDERRVIFEAVAAGACCDMESHRLSGREDRALEALCFLAAFDEPVAPLIQEWRDHESALVRGRLCHMLAGLVLEPAVARLIARGMAENTYSGEVPILPENVETMQSLVSPGFIAGYLAEHTEEAALFGEGDLSWIEMAFDWSSRELRKPDVDV
jgi:hypothetical protein